ncbi:MAG: hypothetical protein PHX12_06030 [Proteiniphilum sp.]|nr:hypothetical protein [Proteiniphilum sp.]
MAGFWDELRAITEAEAQRGNEAFARGANIVNMLNQTTESGLNRAMDYENMAQSGLLSMANLAEDSRQFDTGHQYAMKLAEKSFEQDKTLAEIQNKYAVSFAELQNAYDMAKQVAKNEQELKVLEKQFNHEAEKIVTQQMHEERQLLKSFQLSNQSNSQVGGLPQWMQIYNNTMNRGGN